MYFKIKTIQGLGKCLPYKHEDWHSQMRASLHYTCPVGKPMVHCFDWWLMWEGPVHYGKCQFWAVRSGCCEKVGWTRHEEQASKRNVSSSPLQFWSLDPSLEFLPWPPPSMTECNPSTPLVMVFSIAIRNLTRTPMYALLYFCQQWEQLAQQLGNQYGGFLKN